VRSLARPTRIPHATSPLFPVESWTLNLAMGIGTVLGLGLEVFGLEQGNFFVATEPKERSRDATRPALWLCRTGVDGVAVLAEGSWVGRQG
jgi:hypothetical protein